MTHRPPSGSGVQGILLAAGTSSRFGADKLLHPMQNGIPMAVAAGRALLAALPGALAVVSTEGELADLLRQAGLTVTPCAQAHRGMGASLAWGVRQAPEAGAWLIALADMPCIAPATIWMVAAAITRPRGVAAASFRGRRGHPVAFGAAYGEALASMDGDVGARGVLEAHRENLVLVETTDAGVLLDIDRPGDIVQCGFKP